MYQRKLLVDWYRTRLLFGVSLIGLLSASAGASTSGNPAQAAGSPGGGSSIPLDGSSNQKTSGDMQLAYGLACTPLWLPTFEGYGGPDGNVHCLQAFDGGQGSGLIAGGQFKNVAGLPVLNIARWDGTGWSALAEGLNGSVICLQLYDDGTGEALYAGGTFTSSGGTSLGFIARWDGNTWTPLGNGVNGAVRALAVFDDGTGPALYAGGTFTSAGSVLVDSIAKWDGTQWSALDTGLNIYPNALLAYDDGGGMDLYAAGGFTFAGGLPVNHIAKWDGSYWSPVGNGVTGDLSSLFALEVYDDGTGPALFAGGRFSEAGGLPAKNLAKWDGQQWIGTGGSGTNKIITALHSHNDGGGEALFVGGGFFQAGGQPALKVAKWDGASWSSVGAGLEGGNAVFDFATFDQGGGEALFAGGDFDADAEGEDSFLAKWGCYVTENDYGVYCFGSGNGQVCPCGNPAGSGEGCMNSTGRGAMLWADGSASVASDDFRVIAEQLEPGRNAMLFSGSEAVKGGLGTYLGDGLLCASGDTRLLGVTVSNASGEAFWGPGLLHPQGWGSGEFRTFQVVYRDLGGWPCGSGFNLTNGVRALLQP